MDEAVSYLLDEEEAQRAEWVAPSDPTELKSVKLERSETQVQQLLSLRRA